MSLDREWRTAEDSQALNMVGLAPIYRTGTMANFYLKDLIVDLRSSELLFTVLANRLSLEVIPAATRWWQVRSR